MAQTTAAVKPTPSRITSPSKSPPSKKRRQTRIHANTVTVTGRKSPSSSSAGRGSPSTVSTGRSSPSTSSTGRKTPTRLSGKKSPPTTPTRTPTSSVKNREMSSATVGTAATNGTSTTSSSSLMCMSSSVKVAVRLRPMNKAEETQGTLPVVNASSVDNTLTAIKGNGRGQQRSSFNFDNVFSSYTTQEQVFAATLKPVLVDVLNGFESTVFAYGQTGTGKTHTMEGDLSDPEKYGVIPRSAESIFEVIHRPEYISHSVTVSYLEIYNEELCDLLADDELINHKPASRKQHSTKLDIMEGKDGVVCRGLTERVVESAADVLDVMKSAQKFRKISETKMNKQSSRSHCVFTLRLTAKKRLNDGNIFETRGKLHLVDLAGSECAKTASLDGGLKKSKEGRLSGEGRDEVSRERGRERSNINRSLLTLGRVIIMLKEQSTSKKHSHVRIPYRDSKLTRILQDSLGGHCKTLIIATVSPSILSIEETMSTLNYAHSASGIVNKPIAVSYLSVGASSRTSATTEMTEAKSVEHWQEMEMRMIYLQSQVEEAQAALARQYREQKGIIDRAEKAEEELAEVKNKLKISEYNLKKSTRILEATKETEKRLTSEADDLMKKLEMSIVDGNELHDLLVKSRNADLARKEATKNFHAAVFEQVTEVMDKLDKLEKEGNDYHSNLVTTAEKRNTQEHEELDESVQLLHEIQLHVSDLTMTMKSHVQDENGIMDILSKLTGNVQDNVNLAKQKIDSGEKDLLESIHNTRQNLINYSDKLLEMEKEYDSISGDVVQNLDSLVSQANEKVAKMVSSAVDALVQAREDSSNTRVSLSDTLATFHTVSANSVARIQEQSHKCSKQLTKALETFNDGMKHIDNIQEQLENQQTMIKTDGVSHIDEIEQQKALVITQGSDIKNAKTEQKRLEQVFVEEVLKGVTELINEQMSVLSLKHEEHLNIVEKRNQDLSTLTDDVKSSANNIFSEIDATNQSIYDHSNDIRENDLALIGTADDAHEALVGIEQISNNQREAETKFVETTTEKTSMLEEHENAVAVASATLQTDSVDSMQFMSDKLHTGLKSGVSRLSNLANSQTVYARDTALTTTLSNLEQMESPRENVLSDFSHAAETIHRSVTEGKTKIDKVADKQCSTADDLRGDIESKYNSFNDVVAKRRRTAIDSSKKDVIDNSDNFNRNAKDTILSTITSASNTKTDVDSFATNTIKFKEAVPPIAPRKEIKYNRILSSTPAENVLAKDIVVESE